MPPPPPKVVNIAGASASGSAGTVSHSDLPKPTGVQANTNIGNLAVNVFERFILDLEILCQQYNIGMAGYADPSSAEACYCKGIMPVFGMIQLFHLDSYETEQLWNFQFIRYLANNQWRPWDF